MYGTRLPVLGTNQRCGTPWGGLGGSTSLIGPPHSAELGAGHTPSLIAEHVFTGGDEGIASPQSRTHTLRDDRQPAELMCPLNPSGQGFPSFFDCCQTPDWDVIDGADNT